ncbi:MAG TPA: peptidoglycan DD-metalloendopeptidase family protein [Longimicrobiales bacterium]|nr:peptidoglycan DD-metalloendopeptidase family protein [Longimicrobiales bacterium]
MSISGVVRRASVLLAAGVLSLALPSGSAAQQNDIQRDLRESQLKLDSIQAERQRLQREMETLQNRVRDASRELVNIERQQEASRSALMELDFQAELLTESVERATREHNATRSRLAQRTNDLHARLRSIYKRGRMHSVQVILAAQSFSDLLNRYKYLNLMAIYDRMVVQEFTRLEQQLASQELEMRESLQRLEALRQEKSAEVAQLERAERQRQATLQQFRQQETRTASRLDELEREQQRLAGAIADLERRRREAEASSVTPNLPGSISTRDLGTLSWPVNGNVLYRFGPDRRPNGVVLKHQGIGIAAPAGTAVAAVESGVVEFAGPFPGYGPTVIISHGGGYRTLYLYLQTIEVEVNQVIRAGQGIGTVGGERTAEGAHIEFQVRVPIDGAIEPVDPLAWLRARAGTNIP